MKKDSENKPKETPIIKVRQNSLIVLEINEESITMNCAMVDDLDWARAAWTLIKACEQKGQIEKLKEFSKKYNAEIISGSFDN